MRRRTAPRRWGGFIRRWWSGGRAGWGWRWGPISGRRLAVGFVWGWRLATWSVRRRWGRLIWGAAVRSNGLFVRGFVWGRVCFITAAVGFGWAPAFVVGFIRRRIWSRFLFFFVGLGRITFAWVRGRIWIRRWGTCGGFVRIRRLFFFLFYCFGAGGFPGGGRFRRTGFRGRFLNFWFVPGRRRRTWIRTGTWTGTGIGTIFTFCSYFFPWRWTAAGIFFDFITCGFFGRLIFIIWSGFIGRALGIRGFCIFGNFFFGDFFPWICVNRCFIFCPGDIGSGFRHLVFTGGDQAIFLINNFFCPWRWWRLLLRM